MKTQSKSSATKPVTEVVFWANKVKQSCILDGHLTPSEVERQMLFQKHTPKRAIESWSHKN